MLVGRGKCCAVSTSGSTTTTTDAHGTASHTVSACVWVVLQVYQMDNLFAKHLGRLPNCEWCLSSVCLADGVGHCLPWMLSASVVKLWLSWCSTTVRHCVLMLLQPV